MAELLYRDPERRQGMWDKRPSMAVQARETKVPSGRARAEKTEDLP